MMGEGWGRQRDIAARGRGGGSNNRIEEREGGEIERAEKEKEVAKKGEREGELCLSLAIAFSELSSSCSGGEGVSLSTG